MRVCLETSAVRPPMTGIGYYVLSVARQLLHEAADIDLYSFDGSNVRPLTSLDLSGRAERAAVPRAFPARARALVARSGAARRAYHWLRGQRFQRRATSFDLFHALNFVPPRQTDAPVLPLLHDLSFARLPHTHPAARVSFLEERLKTIDQYPFINTISQFSASEIADFYGYPLNRIGVTYPGVNERMYEAPSPEAVAELLGMELARNSYFLTVGTVEPRKNHKVLIEAYVGMPARLRQRFPLVIVGASGWGSLDVPGQDDLVRDGSIRFLGYGSEPLVHALYANARALLFPTLYEGFGIPVAEAMACGVQPVTSDIPVMREVAGEVGVYIDPQDVEGWRSFLMEAMEGGGGFSSREDLVARSRVFTWQETARKTAELYRRFR